MLLTRNGENRFLYLKIPIFQNKSNYFFCKFLAYHRIPLCQADNLRCSSLKIKRNFTPFAVVVHLIQVDSGGDFLFAFGLGFAFR